jgi:hypothetical protein
MSRRARENLAFLLFFPPLAYVLVRGWERFVAFGCVGGAWLELALPAALMTLALLVWPQRA